MTSREFLEHHGVFEKDKHVPYFKVIELLEEYHSYTCNEFELIRERFPDKTFEELKAIYHHWHT